MFAAALRPLLFDEGQFGVNLGLILGDAIVEKSFLTGDSVHRTSTHSKWKYYNNNRMEYLLFTRWPFCLCTCLNPNQSSTSNSSLFYQFLSTFIFTINITSFAPLFLLLTLSYQLAMKKQLREVGPESRFLSTSSPWTVWMPPLSSNRWALFSWEISFSEHQTPSRYSCLRGR